MEFVGGLVLNEKAVLPSDDVDLGDPILCVVVATSSFLCRTSAGNPFLSNCLTIRRRNQDINVNIHTLCK